MVRNPSNTWLAPITEPTNAEAQKLSTAAASVLPNGGSVTGVAGAVLSLHDRAHTPTVTMAAAANRLRIRRGRMNYY